MIKFVTARDIYRYSTLVRSMFEDRAQQFKRRLRWDVSVDSDGMEIDQYDFHNPLYVIWESPDGSHGGSLRLMPTTGRTMINEHFCHLIGHKPIANAQVWECTRFCLSEKQPDNAPSVAALLFHAACDFGLQAGITQSIGVFDPKMLRVYRRIGWEPRVIGSGYVSDMEVYAGMWEVSEEARQKIFLRSNLKKNVGRIWSSPTFVGEHKKLGATQRQFSVGRLSRQACMETVF